MSFDDHDRCRLCGAPDSPTHTPGDCSRRRAARAEAQRVADAAPLPDPLAPSDRCGHAGLCGWMKSAVHGTLNTPPNGREAVFVFCTREMQHPDTLAIVRRYLVVGAGVERIVRACPACGGNPNETQVMR